MSSYTVSGTAKLSLTELRGKERNPFVTESPTTPRTQLRLAPLLRARVKADAAGEGGEANNCA